jgi:hypothetical protein
MTHRRKVSWVCVLLLQSQAPSLELDDGDGEDMVADQLRQLRESLHDLQPKYDRAEMELKAAHLREQRCVISSVAICDDCTI